MEDLTEKRQSRDQVAWDRLLALKAELELKAHLFNAELNEEWERIEKDWQTIQAELKLLSPAAKRTIYRSMRLTVPLLRKVEHSLIRIREGLERNHQAVS